MNSANIVKGDSIRAALESALDVGNGILRLTPTWVPRSFLHPGKRIRLHPDDGTPMAQNGVELTNAGLPVLPRQPMKDVSGMKA